MNNETLHTTGSAARAAGVPESYVRSLIARGALQPRRDQTRRVILTADDVETIKQQRATSGRCAA